jgi:hypothetical protein
MSFIFNLVSNVDYLVLPLAVEQLKWSSNLVIINDKYILQDISRFIYFYCFVILSIEIL